MRCLKINPRSTLRFPLPYRPPPLSMPSSNSIRLDIFSSTFLSSGLTPLKSHLPGFPGPSGPSHDPFKLHLLSASQALHQRP